MATRRCANWLETYRHYILPRTDAPESFVQWSGIFTIASALRRRVWIPKSDLGLWDCYPYIYLLFVGPAGFRKTTCISKGASVLLDQVPELEAFRSPDVFTKEAIIEEMSKGNEASMNLIVGEFSDIFSKAGKDRGSMYEFFTSMFDDKVRLSSMTKSSGSVFLERPCLNFFSATTPEWIEENMPEAVIGGGFASRIIFVHENKPRLKKSMFRDVQPLPDSGYTNFQSMERDLLVDLIHISTNLAGAFTIPVDSYNWIDDWSADPANTTTDNPKLAGYMQRKFTMVCKLAMIHSASLRDDLTITIQDWKYAIGMMESTEGGLEQIFGGVGKNKYSVDIKNIIGYVVNMFTFTGKPVKYADLLTNFQSAAEPRVLNELITFAVESHALKVENTVIDGTPHTLFFPGNRV